MGDDENARWIEWAAGELLRGSSPDEVRARLTEDGLTDLAAQETVGQVLASPVFAAARPVADHALRLGHVTALLRRLTELRGREVERREHVSDDELLGRFLAHNEPVVITQLLDDWPARDRWTSTYLRERFGDAVVRACVGRDALDEPDRRFEEVTREMPLREYLALVDAVDGESDDLYLIANQRNMERDALAGLLDDVVVPSFCDPAGLEHGTSLWIGPAGTLTRLHHDTTNILFCQVRGRKRVFLASPLETDLLATASDYYNTASPDAGALDALGVRVVDLNAGEALLIPVGWWHWVRALEPSINLSFTCLRWPNRFDFYAPGLVGRRR